MGKRKRGKKDKLTPLKLDIWQQSIYERCETCQIRGSCVGSFHDIPNTTGLRVCKAVPKAPDYAARLASRVNLPVFGNYNHQLQMLLLLDEPLVTAAELSYEVDQWYRKFVTFRELDTGVSLVDRLRRKHAGKIGAGVAFNMGSFEMEFREGKCTSLVRLAELFALCIACQTAQDLFMYVVGPAAGFTAVDMAFLNVLNVVVVDYERAILIVDVAPRHTFVAGRGCRWWGGLTYPYPGLAYNIFGGIQDVWPGFEGPEEEEAPWENAVGDLLLDMYTYV